MTRSDQYLDSMQLADDELDVVNGGMKWQRGTSNSDVVDARGGSFRLFGLLFTFDVNGNFSGVH